MTNPNGPRRAARCLLAGLAGALALLQASASQTAPPPPVSAFFGSAEMLHPLPSPDGRHAAVLLTTPNGRRQLAILNLEPPRQLRTVAGFANADIRQVYWVNNDRLVYTATDLQSSSEGDVLPGLSAIDRDGGNPRELVRRHWQVAETGTNIRSRQLAPDHRLSRLLRDGSADVVIERPERGVQGEWVSSTPLRVNTLDGQSRVIDTGLGTEARHWLLDERGLARAALSQRDGQDTLHWRAGADAPWQVVHRGRSFVGEPGSFVPHAIGPQGELYALAVRNDAARTRALFRFDPKTLRLEPEPVVGLQGFDFDGRLVFDTQRRQLLGAHFTSDAAGSAWIDAGMKAAQDKVDQLLPGTLNLLDPAECHCTRWLIVTAGADRQPPIYLLYDREKHTLEAIGRARKAIDPRQMAGREFVRITARDGLGFPLHLTKPAGKGPWPAVVLVHGGPYLRGGAWEWDAQSQFLASRGYLVIEPEFRGSLGYGDALFRAGWKQWGLKMQDDIADATRWAIAQGHADPQRICIAGGSYGGYASLMGLIKDPALYRCGVAWAAVSDIGLMHTIGRRWTDVSEVWRQHGLPALVADPEKDAAQIAATSPARLAAQLKQPLLLAHGEADLRVPFEHGVRMRNALREAGHRQLEWIAYPDEGHGWSKPENRYDFWTRVEQFLATHLAKP
jgi:dipeptidyl aminopeptidase/acylaminoacyl peptidase